MKNTNREIVEKLLKSLDEPTTKKLMYTVGDAHIDFAFVGDSVHASLYLQSDEDELVDAARHGDEYFKEMGITLFDGMDMVDVWFLFDDEEDYINKDVDLAILEALVNACNGQFKSLLHTSGKVHDRIFENVSEEMFCRAVENNGIGE